MLPRKRTFRTGTLLLSADIEKVGHQLGTGYLRGLGPEAINTLLRLGKLQILRRQPALQRRAPRSLGAS